MRVLTVFLAVAGLAVAAPSASYGATIAVNSTSDESMADGHCSLREAITAANTDSAPNPGAGECPSGSGTDTIVLPVGRYVLTILGAHEDANASGDLDISGPTSLIGAGAGATTVDASHIDRAIQVLMGADVTISGVTITDGLAPSGENGTNQTGAPGGVGAGGDGGPGDSGGGILNDGTLSVLDSVITRNAAGVGGIGGIGTGGSATRVKVASQAGSGSAARAASAAQAEACSPPVPR